MKNFTIYAVRRALALALAIWLSAAAPSYADLFYTVSNYSNGSAGVIAVNGGEHVNRKKVVVGYGVDAAGFTFTDHEGRERALVREYTYGPDDTVYIYDPANWQAPLVNGKGFATNIHAAASGGQYLYLASYESHNASGEDSGEVVRVDMKNGYKADRRYQYKRFTGDAGFTSTPHGEGVAVINGKVYVLFGVSYNGVNEYEPCEVLEFDAELNLLRKIRLTDGARIGKNSMSMTVHNGRIYVACMGGYQGPNSWGDIWEVDPGSGVARQILDGRDMTYQLPDGTTPAVGMYGLQFASDGTAFVLTGSYSAEYRFRARLFRTTAAALSAGNPGSLMKEYTDRMGYSWGILYDERDGVLWCMTGQYMDAWSKSGALTRTYSPNDLGDNIYSISILNELNDVPPGNGNGGGSGGGGGGCNAGLGFAGLAAMTGLIIRARREKRK